MATKRLTLELAIEHYDFLYQQAHRSGTTVSGLLRKFIEDHRKLSSSVKKDFTKDPFFERKGSFVGPRDLAENHDKELYL